MRTFNFKTIVSLALTGLFFTAAAAQADYVYRDVAPQDDIDKCVAVIAEQANYDGADFVRHEVKSKARSTIGYTLHISTQVYGETDGQLIREYRTMCAVSKRPEPVAFKIRETK